jgi:hypothetical protein
MCNCNQKRAAYLAATSPSYRGMVKVMLLSPEPMVLNGNITGRMYLFRKKNEMVWVDKRDAISMLELPGLQVVL